jgi:type IV pilus assembly protein PilM
VQAVADAIKRAVKRSGTRAKAAAVAVAGSANHEEPTCRRVLRTMSWAVRSSWRPINPFLPLEEVKLDYLVLGPSKRISRWSMYCSPLRVAKTLMRVEAVELAGLTAKVVGVKLTR